MRRFATLVVVVFSLAACGGEDAESTTTTAAPEATTTTSPATTTTTAEAVSVHDVICFPILGAPQTGRDSCEGDDTYASVTLNTPALIEATLDNMVTELGFPSSLSARVGNTRSLDGTLEAESPDGYSASWTYHPDDGLGMVVERTG